MNKVLCPTPQWGVKNPVRNTDNFIETFLTPKTDYPVKDYFEIFRWHRYIDNNWIQELIAEMPYDAFLLSRYWENIRLYKLAKAHFKCEKCGKSYGLNVHHLKYDNHGLEHYKDVAENDLIVLCKDCHKLTHLRGGVL